MASRHLLPLLIGLSLGLMLGGAPSCGPAAPSSSCGPATCQGCCSAGKCVVSPNNAARASCGKNGAACANCGARACLDFSCADSDAGSARCGAGSCGGCCSGSSSTSVCITVPSATNCGADGGQCTSCLAGQACLAGSCKAVDGGAGQVGTACTQNSECAALGAGHTCKRTTTSGGSQYPDGYCTLSCARDLDCPGKALCLGPQPGYGENDSVCWASCGSAEECRSGYDCYAVGGGEAACWLAPLPPFDGGPPADKIGQPCGNDATCRNPPDDGACLTERLIDGGSSAFVGGYCSAPCDESSHCSPDGGAACISLGTFGACVTTCPTPLQGQGSCRAGYVCQGLRASPDGGSLPIGFCWPNCNNPGGGCATGSVCKATGYCG